MLVLYFVRDRGLDKKAIANFMAANYSNDENFDIHDATSDVAWQVYTNWIKTKSTEALYYEEVKKSFMFIENMCINKNISLEEYKKAYAISHIREKKIDWAVAVHLKLIDKSKLKTVEKLLLKSFLTQYNIIINRLYNPKLSQLMSDLEDGMKRLLSEYNLDDDQKVKTSTN